MPVIGEELFSFDPIDRHVEPDVFVAGVGDPPAGALPDGERLTGKIDAEPITEFFGIGEGSPDPRAGR
jgi:hypothetical protein